MLLLTDVIQETFGHLTDRSAALKGRGTMGISGQITFPIMLSVRCFCLISDCKLTGNQGQGNPWNILEKGQPEGGKKKGHTTLESHS